MRFALSLVLTLRWLSVVYAYAWTTEQLAMYDLVEDIGQSFYDFFGVARDASISDIKKAYRRLSMEWHPDRNADVNAEEQFRKIAAMYEVLKTRELREKYDSVLENGLPNWKQPIFYYRRAQKMSWFEAVVVLTVICSIGHYFMLWGAYIDKYLTLCSNRSKLRKKEIRQLKKTGADAELKYEAEIAEMLSDVWPSWRNSLPILIVSLLYKIAVLLPRFVRGCIDEKCSRTTDAAEGGNSEDVPSRRYVATPQPVYQYAVASDVKPVSTCVPFSEEPEKQFGSHSGFGSNNGAWSSEELALLVRLSSEKYPVGTPNRWNLMAKTLNRSPDHISSMMTALKQLRKEEQADLLRNAQSSSVVEDAARITALCPEKFNNPLRNENAAANSCTTANWSEHDQKQLETALQAFPKGTTDRWDKIANCVHTKSRQQCIERFKYLSEMVRQRKSQHKNKKK